MILEMDPRWDVVRRNAFCDEVDQLRFRNDLPGSGNDRHDGNLTLVGICCADHGRHRHGGGVQIGVTPGAAAVHQAALATRRQRVCGDEASQGGEASLLWRFGHGISRVWRWCDHCSERHRSADVPAVARAPPVGLRFETVRVAIAGGHGQIALRLAKILSGRGDEVVALIRNPNHAEDVRQAGAEPAVVDLEHASDDEVARAIAGSDAVVFAAGAGAGSGSARKETMDYGGAVKLITAAKQVEAGRYVIVSSMGANPDASGEDTFSVYLRAKGRADDAVRASGLDATVVRPGGLTNNAGTGRVRLGESVPRGQVSRDDVAAVLVAVLDSPNTIGRTVDLIGGDTPVAEAVAAI